MSEKKPSVAERLARRGAAGAQGAVAGGAIASMAAGGSPRKDALVRAGLVSGAALGMLGKEKKAAASASTGLRGRSTDSMFSEGFEQANIQGTNELLSELISQKDKMAELTEQQLSGLLTSPSHGRVRNLGPTAVQASSVLRRALKG